MRHGLLIALVLASLAGVSNVSAQDRRMTEVLVPRDPGPNEAVRARVVTGPLPFGGRLVVKTEQGDVIGSIMSYGVPNPHDTRSETFPVPSRNVINRRLRLQVLVEAPGAMTRRATPDEIIKLEVTIVPRVP
ncbi:hypothetical protein [Bradyrhizobium cenepequi]|uniref:hypothetical protein n=1 Tax=Bradyrhizobium cenepequi TaxID=2821403 RepID=UPI001CE301F1|nr:hypothetical protein [Bradyrhizobium cenepequi]MCA6106848.1 hypothetical protein [Bradyrhizobium cenepequi]